MSVLLPEPDAPVIAISLPSGNVTSTDFRLFSRAPRTVSVLPLPLRRRFGVSIAPLAREDTARSAMPCRP